MNSRTSIVFIALAAGCLGAAQATDKVRAVNEGGIRDQWMLADGVTLAVPGYPAALARSRARDVCLALGYRINPDGTTSEFRVLKQWNSETQAREPEDGFWAEYAHSGAEAVAQWKFKPRPEVAAPVPVDTVATLTWQGNKGGDAAALRAHCRIDDLAAHLQDLKRREGLNDKGIERDNMARDRELQRRALTPRTGR